MASRTGRAELFPINGRAELFPINGRAELYRITGQGARAPILLTPCTGLYTVLTLY